jgi:hypothetical protein
MVAPEEAPSTRIVPAESGFFTLEEQIDISIMFNDHMEACHAARLQSEAPNEEAISEVTDVHMEEEEEENEEEAEAVRNMFRDIWRLEDEEDSRDRQPSHERSMLRTAHALFMTDFIVLMFVAGVV